jgi:eRF1 domain 1
MSKGLTSQLRQHNIEHFLQRGYHLYCLLYWTLKRQRQLISSWFILTLAIMRLIKKGIAHRNGEGFVRLQADEAEDMYHLFNLICEGDIIGAETIRNVRMLSQCYLGRDSEIFRNYLSARIYVFCKYLISWFQ